jgi:membrane glycosyltransferase
MSLNSTGYSDFFDLHLLSDSSEAEIISEEETRLKAWQTRSPKKPLFYRRRGFNTDYKPGNLREFCDRAGHEYEFIVLLDADSLMSGREIVRHVRTMTANPRLGILQSVIVGILPPSFFARVYEFGHRHGLHCSIVGAVWWQGDRCQFWGHNATIRLAPFIKYCRLPEFLGKGAFAGHIICHDQIEASLIHSAGYDVRVLPVETGSYEETPPTFLDFAKRNHRWCQGNFKNLRVLAMRGLPAIDRFQLAIVAQRFLAWPATICFVTLAVAPTILWPSDMPFAKQSAGILYFVWMLLFFAPKLLGILDAILREGQKYGGAARLVLGALTELVFTSLLTPVSMFEATRFMMYLATGRRLDWDVQRRSSHRITMRSALRVLWLPTAYGMLLSALLAIENAAALFWFLPFLLGLVFCIPFVALTSAPALNAWALRKRLCAVPEELSPSTEITMQRTFVEMLPSHL